MAQRYVYLSTHRPVDIGTHPKGGLVQFKNFDCRKDCGGTMAWGWLAYNRELNQTEQKIYELKFMGIKELSDNADT